MRFIKFVGIVCAIGAVLCMTGYDCPECDFTKQTIALIGCAVIATICGLIVLNHEQKTNEGNHF